MEQQQCAACAAEERGRKYPRTETFRKLLTLTILSIAILALGTYVHHYRTSHEMGHPPVLVVFFLFVEFACVCVVFIAMTEALEATIGIAIRNGIGQRVYRFRDRAGREHAHAKTSLWPRRFNSRWIANEEASNWIANEEAYEAAQQLHDVEAARTHLVDGPILKLRHGGWFRRCAVIGHPQIASRWRVWSWNGDTVRCTDADGCAIGPLPVADALDLIRSTRSVREWMNQKRAAEAARELFGRGIVEMEIVLDRAPKTIGRTKHARVFRHLIARIYRGFEQARDTGMRPLPTAVDMENESGKPSLVHIARWRMDAVDLDNAALVREALGEDPKPEPRPDTVAQEQA